MTVAPEETRKTLNGYVERACSRSTCRETGENPAGKPDNFIIQATPHTLNESNHP